MGTAMHNTAARGARLTEAEQDRIVELAGRGLGAVLIAREIGRGAPVVQRFLYCAGLRSPEYGSSTAYVRSNGRSVKPWSPEEDRFITDLRREGKGTTVIARLVTEAHGHPRSPDTVYNRLVMLAARDEDAA